MADWSWKQAVASRVLQIVNRKNSVAFSLDEVYAYTDELSRLFPRNRNVRPKIRQVLQRLRDHEGFVSFLGEGRYSLNLEYQELQGEPVLRGQDGVESPITKRVFRNVRLRNTFLAAEIKRRYGDICQVCRIPLVIAATRYYAEAHHLRPMGQPHLGPDTAGNIIVLCPNHHAMFDQGVATIIPGSLKIAHQVEDVFPQQARLYVEPWHVLNRKHLEYHHRRFCEAAA